MKLKKLLCLLLILCFAFSMFACGSSNDPYDDNGGTNDGGNKDDDNGSKDDSNSDKDDSNSDKDDSSNKDDSSDEIIIDGDGNILLPIVPLK